MDVISHALWSAAAFLNYNPWLAVLAGVLPDIIPFATLTSYQIIKKEPFRAHHFGSMKARYHEYPQSLRDFAERSYKITHSLIISTATILVTWILFGIQVWMLAWTLHILIDIPLHKKSFFGTQIFWPISNWAFDGIYWSNPRVLLLNALALIITWAVILF